MDLLEGEPAVVEGTGLDISTGEARACEAQWVSHVEGSEPKPCPNQAEFSALVICETTDEAYGKFYCAGCLTEINVCIHEPERHPAHIVASYPIGG